MERKHRAAIASLRSQHAMAKSVMALKSEYGLKENHKVDDNLGKSIATAIAVEEKSGAKENTVDEDGIAKVSFAKSTEVFGDPSTSKTHEIPAALEKPSVRSNEAKLPPDENTEEWSLAVLQIRQSAVGSFV
nr:hypothetical protein Itr_chr08CG00010 [Ipomoea trifida]